MSNESSYPIGASSDPTAPFNQPQEDLSGACKQCGVATFSICERCLDPVCRSHSGLIGEATLMDGQTRGVRYCKDCVCKFCTRSPKNAQHAVLCDACCAAFAAVKLEVRP